MTSKDLHTLIYGLENSASLVASLRAEVKGHLNNCLLSAKIIVSRLKAIDDHANAHYERCRSKYDLCRSKQEIAFKVHKTFTVCDNEIHNMRKAENEFYKARSARQQAEMRLQYMEREITYYEHPLGGDGIMDSVINDYIPSAINRLIQLNEIAQQYETLTVL